VWERVNRLGMRGTGRSRRVGIAGKPHGGQGVEEGFESGLYLEQLTAVRKLSAK
jgi:hypothetical protein